ncbi:DUF86 domain-containing protein [Candidatus Pacearchaeota archaeon]|nr:DUF86 domain-containing protein [Candidatus Pacearchaeota archaeon]
MGDRKGDKIVEIEEYSDKLTEFFPSDFKNYTSDEKTKAACERYFEKIVESVVDLAFFTIKEENFRAPEFDREAFEILAGKNLISEKLSLNLGNAKSMRNWLAHRYGKVDDKKVFEAIRDKLFYDVRDFLEAIK